MRVLKAADLILTRLETPGYVTITFHPTRRVELLEEAGRIWQQRAEQNSAKEEG